MKNYISRSKVKQDPLIQTSHLHIFDSFERDWALPRQPNLQIRSSFFNFNVLSFQR